MRTCTLCKTNMQACKYPMHCCTKPCCEHCEKEFLSKSRFLQHEHARKACKNCNVMVCYGNSHACRVVKSCPKDCGFETWNLGALSNHIKSCVLHTCEVCNITYGGKHPLIVDHKRIKESSILYNAILKIIGSVSAAWYVTPVFVVKDTRCITYVFSEDGIFKHNEELPFKIITDPLKYALQKLKGTFIVNIAFHSFPFDEIVMLQSHYKEARSLSDPVNFM